MSQRSELSEVQMAQIRKIKNCMIWRKVERKRIQHEMCLTLSGRWGVIGEKYMPLDVIKGIVSYAYIKVNCPEEYVYSPRYLSSYEPKTEEKLSQVT